jgi:hypothetical protein
MEQSFYHKSNTTVFNTFFYIYLYLRLIDINQTSKIYLVCTDLRKLTRKSQNCSMFRGTTAYFKTRTFCLLLRLYGLVSISSFTVVKSSENRERDRCIFCRASFASIFPPLAAIKALKISPLSFWSGCGSTFSSFARRRRSAAMSTHTRICTRSRMIRAQNPKTCANQSMKSAYTCHRERIAWRKPPLFTSWQSWKLAGSPPSTT